MKRYQVKVLNSGRVQRIGFRYTAKTVAAGYEMTGVIRNLPDGRVEMICEGSREELEAFLQAIRESGLGRLIDREETNWNDSCIGYRDFEIVS
jgi:acylphosphatase